MPIKFPPRRAQILLCDYSLGGFKPPEMVKRRPVVIVNGRLPERDSLAIVVPLSGTPPRKASIDYQIKLTLSEPLPPPFDDHEDWWVKADMVGSVSYARLDLFRSARAEGGRRRYFTPHVTEAQFNEICLAVLRALRFDH